MNILKQIEQGESKIIEFKERLPKNNSIVKTVIAFSNTSGGKLIIGVSDNKEIVGIQKVRKLCDKYNIRFELNEKGTFVEALFYRPSSNTLLPKNVKEVPNTTANDRIRPNTTANDRLIIEYINKNSAINRSEAKVLLGIGETKIKEIFNDLIEKGLIRRVGAGRSTHYVLKEHFDG